jgi:hypothetical protein
MRASRRRPPLCIIYTRHARLAPIISYLLTDTYYYVIQPTYNKIEGLLTALAVITIPVSTGLSKLFKDNRNKENCSHRSLVTSYMPRGAE